MDLLKTGTPEIDVRWFLERWPRGSPEFMHAALRGIIPGVRRTVFGGHNADLDVASVPEGIWGGDGLIPNPTAAESWEVLSTDANDTAAGTGARTITVTTLNASYQEIVQTVTLNGVTAVALTGTHFRINSATLLTAGSSGSPAGTISFRVAPAGATRAYMRDGILNQCKYTVPDGYGLDLHAAVVGLRTTSGTTESAVFTTRVTNAAGRQLDVLNIPINVAGSNTYRHEVLGGMVPFNSVSAKSSFEIVGTLVTVNNTALDATVLGLLYQKALWP